MKVTAGRSEKAVAATQTPAVSREDAQIKNLEKQKELLQDRIKEINSGKQDEVTKRGRVKVIQEQITALDTEIKNLQMEKMQKAQKMDDESIEKREDKNRDTLEINGVSVVPGLKTGVDSAVMAGMGELLKASSAQDQARILHKTGKSAKFEQVIFEAYAAKQMAHNGTVSPYIKDHISQLKEVEKKAEKKLEKSLERTTEKVSQATNVIEQKLEEGEETNENGKMEFIEPGVPRRRASKIKINLEI